MNDITGHSPDVAGRAPLRLQPLSNDRVTSVCLLIACFSFTACISPPIDGLPDASLASLDSGLSIADSGALEEDAGQAPFDGGPLTGALVAVGHQRELRAIWYATVFNIDFPVDKARSKASAEVEFDALVTFAKQHGFNAIVFQVRGESDTLYTSFREPWSRFLSGTQGTSPGYDPLAMLIEKAHRVGIEVHAWLNPYRGIASTRVPFPVASTHVTQLLPAEALPYGTAVVMNPGAAPVQDWVVDTVEDVVRGFDVDGIHFDDYFYPYPIDNTPFPDEGTYQDYVGDGGMRNKSDWRRDNVNTLIRRVSERIVAIKPWVRFGVSPFGIFRPNQPPGIVGLDAYEALSCDAPLWMQNGWVDYLAPQLYWTTKSVGQNFTKLIAWWADVAKQGRFIVVGHGPFRLSTQGADAGWTADEFKTQVAQARALAPAVAGGMWFSYKDLRSNTAGISDLLRTTYASPALPPAIASQRNTTVPAPDVTVNSRTLTLAAADATPLRLFALYRFERGAYQLTQLIPATNASSLPLLPGQYAVTAVGRSDVESQGRVVRIP
jgi:uncharacterized lipoprotein YddW (UPF0748 family)